ncbi:peptide chain release factor N(5)-glutamine methyltransferase [Antribacter sp. KLBMP9083]|uniref:Peptide chain release factor N(5)-glutamine methyltransferase n=1 Tax=Antribacter soli TaxID=2910976 RepID=A0AA41QB25_9MICO|nr:HemK/PrmC family methyltransferase [Antribacter soli]MCF4120175.1 peptide chain release factor N(5)-glutamine methyltransferase [Antribacter soli]
MPELEDAVPTTTDGAVRWGAAALADAGVATPRVDAELLLAHVLGADRGEVVRLALLGTPLPDDVRAAFADHVTRRAARVPLQHLTGLAPFRHLELVVGPGVFVPRPETESVAQVAVDEAARVVAERGSAVVVDLCTGSGAIALAVATEVPGAAVHAVELDAAAHAWAERNVAALLLVGAESAAPGGPQAAPSPPAAGTRVRLVRGDARTALRELDGTVDVVVSNPPYVPPGAVPVDPEVAEHDPAVALYGLGADGLEVPRGVTAAAARLLRPGGLYVMEHAEVQAAAARAMVDATPGPEPVAAPDAAPGPAFTPAETREDLTGRPRMVVARRR